MRTVTNPASFLNPQMTQIEADGEEDAQNAQTVVEALVSRASDRKAVGTNASTTSVTAPGARLDHRGLH